ncbi:MerR family transcriptional regulator [Levilactobacillus tongjiangensis]|uniref:MerR family transcriptional regulator n=1 Tax=Levilactobacillus tongjiangensis TaxID=2486023 RepID=A0ABW1SQQ5_9LACO|nr:MerR family transcriptional regulator [Levilactobacillus tongjiangensis]
MKIKEVSTKFNVPADTLRYWEREGAIPPVTRNEMGYRDYDDEDLDWIVFAKCMREAGVSIEYLIEYITLFKQGDATLQARKDLLCEQLEVIAQRLQEIQHTYDLIKNKTEHYEERVEGYHGKLSQ